MDGLMGLVAGPAPYLSYWAGQDIYIDEMTMGGYGIQ